jgi:hypothetical protein
MTYYVMRDCDCYYVLNEDELHNPEDIVAECYDEEWAKTISKALAEHEMKNEESS